MLADFGELPGNFSIEYKVIDFAGNAGINSTYNNAYKNIIFSREKEISLTDDNIDLNSVENREISFANSGQFNNVNFLDVYISGFRYGTACLNLEQTYYELSFGTDNSKETLLAYSDSLVSDYIYSNLNPLNHISWEVREDDYYAVVKHVLVDGEIVIINPLTYNKTAQLEIDHLYDRGFGLSDLLRIKRVYYVNSSDNEICSLSFGVDYMLEDRGFISFPETSKLHILYDNSSEIQNGIIYFEYDASLIGDQLSLTNADGFFINFTMPAVYYDHTTIEKLTINFNDLLGNSFSKVYFDLDLRKYFLESVKEQYEVDIFGLGKMMTIPLYIDLNEIGLSNRDKPFALSFLESISFEIKDSPRWPGSFVQEFEDFTVMNLPYQRIGISDIKLYNLISDSFDEDNDGYVSSTVRFVAPDYYINYRWNNGLSQVLLNDIYMLPVELINATSKEMLSLGSANWITKYDRDSLAGYLTKYYYSRFKVPYGLTEYEVTFGSKGTPLFNINFLNAPIFTLNVTQESLSLTEPIYLENDQFEVEYGDPLILRGAVLDNDEYLVEGEVHDYKYQEALDGETTHTLKLVTPFGDSEFIDKTEFAIYYINDQLETLPLYSSLNGNYFKDDSILDYNKDVTISYVDNAFILNIYWEKDSSSFIRYDTNLLISYKVMKGQPLSPISYSSVDSYGNNKQQNLVEVPFARYDMITRSWITEDDFIQRFPIDKLLLYKEVESTGATIEGPTFFDGQEIITGIIGLDSIYVNKSYSNTFEWVNSSSLWDIDNSGRLVVSGLNYSQGDVFKVGYFAYYPTDLSHSLTKDVSSIECVKVRNVTGFEYTFVEDIDYKLSEDGYSVYFLDFYNTIIESGNFSIYDTFEIKYRAPLTKQIDLSQNVLLLLQDSEGNNVPIDTIPIDSLGMFDYEKTLQIDSPLSIPVGSGRKIVHMELAYMPLNFYNKTSDQLENIDYYDNDVGNIYAVKESNSWARPITVVTIPNKVKLSLVEDPLENIVINQKFYEEREYFFNLNPVDALENGEEYSKVMIDALVREDYKFTFRLTDLLEDKPINDSIVWLQIGFVPKTKSKFVNERVVIDDLGISPYFESLGTEDITFLGPGMGAEKMFGRPLTYELDEYNTNYSAYGPYTWQFARTNDFGEVSFDVSFDLDYLKDFSDIFGSIEGFDSIDDTMLYIRAFSSYFNWSEFSIDSPNQYLCSENGDIYDGSTALSNYDFTNLALQDSTYLEGLITLHKKDIALGINDYYSYDLPDSEVGGDYKPITIHLYVTEANPIPSMIGSTVDSLTKTYTSSQLEPTSHSILGDNYSYYAYLDFYTPSGSLAESMFMEIHPEFNSGIITIDNETVIQILSKLGPGISTIKIQVAESECYKRSPTVRVPLEIRPASWIKYGQKNTHIDLIDPFINAWGNAFNGEEFIPFESNYPHLIGTVWIEPDFEGTGEEKERSIQDYIEISLDCITESIIPIDEVPEGVSYEVDPTNPSLAIVKDSFPLRENIMLRPGNRDGIMMFSVGLGPEDAFLMDLECGLNLTFNIDYNTFDIYEDDREVEIYLLDLRLEENPSSSNPNTIWSVYSDGFDDTGKGFAISKDDSVQTATGVMSLGGTENEVNYGVNVEFTYDPEESKYRISSESELLRLLELEDITPLEIRGLNNSEQINFIKDTDWQEGTEFTEIEFLTNTLPDNYSEFTVVYKFDFNFGTNKFTNITLGPNLGNNANESWILLDLPEGFLPPSEDSRSPMYVRFNETFVGTGSLEQYTLEYGVQGADTWDTGLFIVYNEEELSISDRDVLGGRPRIQLTKPADEIFNVIYGVNSQYLLGYGFQKINESYSDSVRLAYNNESAAPIINSLGAINPATLSDPSLYISLDDSPEETILELYNVPLLYAPEVNFTFTLDPIVMDLVDTYTGFDVNTLKIDFYYVASGGYGSYYTDTIELPLNYTELSPDLESGNYFIEYNKDLQGIYDAFGTGNLDIYVSISQIGNGSNYIPYIILEQFDYLCDEHLIEMYDRMPLDKYGDLDIEAVINTPHYTQILSKPFIDGIYGDSPFDLLDGSQITVSLDDPLYSSLISLQNNGQGDYSFDHLGTRETLPINAENYYMIPNLALYVDAYDLDEVVYEDFFLDLFYGSGVDVSGEHDFDARIDIAYGSTEVDDYEASIEGGVITSWEDAYNLTDQFLTTDEITVSDTVLYHQLYDLTSD
jgi:tetrahydromethanopterin S-methyltransferase subunit B